MQPDIWYTEEHAPGVRFSMQVSREVARCRSDFQDICILDTREFGRILVMDGYLMLTEKDEYIYHEMIVHPAFAVHPGIRKVLVIGGGDGGAVRELCKYPLPLQIDLVDIDEDVIQLCKEYLPQTACSLDDSRVTVHIADGVQFVRRCTGQYDLVIVDSTDPFGPGEGLFTKEFYGSCFKALKADGLLINQHESAFYDEYTAAMRRTHSRIKGLFKHAAIYQIHMPTYASGHWLFGFASKQYHPLDDHQPATWAEFGIETKYYNANLHRGAFALPNYVINNLNIDPLKID